MKKVNGNDGEEKYLKGDGNDGEESEQWRWKRITQWTWTVREGERTATMTVREGERTMNGEGVIAVESNRSWEKTQLRKRNSL
jgi:type IV secretory pathway TrbL component